MKNRAAAHITPGRQSGFSLIELLVAMVIGLIMSLAIFSVLQNLEGRKRTSTSINDIDQAGNYAAYALDKLVRSAGSGISQSDGAMFGCSLTAMKDNAQILPRTAALPAPFAAVNTGTANVFKLIPALIAPGQTTPGVSNKPSDVLVLMSGNGGFGEVATQFTGTPVVAQLTLANTIGFRGDDLVLINDLSAGPTGTPCMIEQVSAGFAGGATTALTLRAAGAGSYSGATINGKALTSYNDTNNTMALNLGNVSTGNPPTFIVVGVGNNNTLFGFDLLQNQNPTIGGAQASYPIADNIFELHALYGIDANNDDKIDTWNAATGNYSPANLTNGTVDAFKRLKTIKAIRIGLITRTSLLEKVPDSPTPISPASLVLFEDIAAPVAGAIPKVTRTLNADITSEERRYRYKTIETTIPLRNQIMISP